MEKPVSHIFKNAVFLIPLVLFSGLTTVYAQKTEVPSSVVPDFSNSVSKSNDLESVLDPSTSRNVTTFDNRYEGVKGTPYLFENWQKGILFFKDSTRSRDSLTMNFDLTTNEIWYRISEKQERVLFSNNVLALDFKAPNGETVRLRKVRFSNNTTNHYFSVLVHESPNFILVKDIKKVFKKANLEDRGLYTVGNAYDSFEDQPSYYFSTNRRTFEKIKLRKSDIVENSKLSGGQIRSVQEYCKKNGIENKITEAQAANLLTFIQSLLK
jgi:hypothetical protein